MIYIDSSVALAYLLAESRAPAANLWRAELVSSRLLEYEVWTRIHARQLTLLLERQTRELLAGIELIEMSEQVLSRALTPFPIVIRTLDALHLATLEYLRSRAPSIELASHDDRLTAGARAIGIPIAAI